MVPIDSLPVSRIQPIFFLFEDQPHTRIQFPFPLSVAVTVVCLCPLSLLNHGHRAEKMFVSWFLVTRWLAHGTFQLCRSFTTLSRVLSPVRKSSLGNFPCKLTFPRSVDRRVGNLDLLPTRYAIPQTSRPTPAPRSPTHALTRFFPDVVKTRMQLDTGKSQGVNCPAEVPRFEWRD